MISEVSACKGGDALKGKQTFVVATLENLLQEKMLTSRDRKGSIIHTKLKKKEKLTKKATKQREVVKICVLRVSLCIWHTRLGALYWFVDENCSLFSSPCM